MHIYFLQVQALPQRLQMKLFADRGGLRLAEPSVCDNPRPGLQCTADIFERGTGSLHTELIGNSHEIVVPDV